MAVQARALYELIERLNDTDKAVVCRVVEGLLIAQGDDTILSDVEKKEYLADLSEMKKGEFFSLSDVVRH